MTIAPGTRVVARADGSVSIIPNTSNNKGIFNNSGSILTNIGSGIFGGIRNKILSNITQDAEEEEYMNRTGWFGSLARGQEMENVYMAANRERIPMILEYLTTEVGKEQHSQRGYLNAGNRKTITMYINPSRLQFNNQKVTSESITRGGIFYHHWGDKNTILSISGDTGLASMAAIKKIDEVYRMSGVLLRYGENTQGPVYWDANTDLMNQIACGNWTGALTRVLSGKASLRDLTGAAYTHTIGAAQDAITRKKNNGLQSSIMAKKVTQTVGGALQKSTGVLNNNSANSFLSTKSPISDVAETAFGGIINRLGEKIGNKLYGRHTSGALDYLDENAITFEESYGGFNDIIDELEDPWRPRLIWIYFEDHCYIGHFQNFNYTRDASSVNIKYEMSFVIQREVILTSFAPTLPGFEAAQGGSEADDMYNQGPTRTVSSSGKFLGNLIGIKR